jgi:hypothetical protein
MFFDQFNRRRPGPACLHWALRALLCGVASGLVTLAQAGAEHRLRLLPDGQLAGQGANHFGQVQPGLPAVVPKPQKLKLPARQWRAVATGGRHSVAIDAAGKVWSWGDNSSGQLGLGHTRPVSQAQRVANLPHKAVAVAAGMQHSVVQLSDGSIWAWGANNQGQLGNGGADAFGVTPQALRVTEPPPEMRTALAAGRVAVAAAPVVVAPVAVRPAAAAVVAAAPAVAPAVSAPVAIRPAVAVAPAVLMPSAQAASAAPAAVEARPVPAPVPLTAAEVLISGTVLLSGEPLPNVRVLADAARCSSTDKLGRYVCKVAPGWSGRISLQRNNYQFSPNALSLQGVRTHLGQQDFAAIYEPR